MMIRFASQCLFWLCLVACQSFAVDNPRLYSGVIQIPSLGDMEMTLGISDTDEGTVLLLTVPIQGAKNVPMSTSFTQEGAIRAGIPQADLVFVVAENPDKTMLRGKMEQGGMTLTIEFSRVDKIATLNRPQTPREPFPYTSREVTSLHPEGHLLAGTLTIPDGEGPFPCAVLISGSGQQDRDESLLGHKPFLILADDLSRNGIAVLRFDDRGVGGSIMKTPDDVLGDTSADFATDVAVMVHAARMHPEIDAKRVGVIGHSEGGLIGPLVAVNDDALDFVVMLAGPGVPGYELLPVQQSMILKTNGVSQELIDTIVDTSMNLYDMLREGAPDEEIKNQLIKLVRHQFEAMQLTISEELMAEAVESGFTEMTLPWMKYFLSHDPALVLAKVNCPVLAINGSLDVQVSSKQNLPAIERAMHAVGGNITIIELEGLNHLFQRATSGAVSEYASIETTIDPVALEVVREWVLEITDND